MRHLPLLHCMHRLVFHLLSVVCFSVPDSLWREDNGFVSGRNTDAPMPRGNESYVNARRDMKQHFHESFGFREVRSPMSVEQEMVSVQLPNDMWLRCQPARLHFCTDSLKDNLLMPFPHSDI